MEFASRNVKQGKGKKQFGEVNVGTRMCMVRLHAPLLLFTSAQFWELKLSSDTNPWLDSEAPELFLLQVSRPPKTNFKSRLKFL